MLSRISEFDDPWKYARIYRVECIKGPYLEAPGGAGVTRAGSQSVYG